MPIPLLKFSDKDYTHFRRRLFDAQKAVIIHKNKVLLLDKILNVTQICSKINDLILFFMYNNNTRKITEREVTKYEENEIFYAFDMPYSLVLLLLGEIDRGAQEMGGD